MGLEMGVVFRPCKGRFPDRSIQGTGRTETCVADTAGNRRHVPYLPRMNVLIVTDLTRGKCPKGELSWHLHYITNQQPPRHGIAAVTCSWKFTEFGVVPVLDVLRQVFRRYVVTAAFLDPKQAFALCCKDLEQLGRCI